ncbi:DUF6668 family protein [Streptomyces sp. NPDC007851]|uniref:DUF6668 family protein n=1 Tax=Streptomyces sp. NPDC007851 TaxID=3155008 RepID=UPI0033C75DAE
MSGPAATPAMDVWIRGPVPAQHDPHAHHPPAAPATETPLPAEAYAQHAPAPAVVRGAAPADALVRTGGGGGHEGAGEIAGPASRTSGVSWANAHGGAGATTFAAAFGGTDIGHAWPDIAQGEPGRMLLLARTHVRGLQAASKALDALRTGRHPAGVELVALVLVADAPGRLPAELSRRVHVLRSAVHTISIPWIPQWRVGKPVAKAPKAVADLAALVGPARPPQKDRF